MDTMDLVLFSITLIAQIANREFLLNNALLLKKKSKKGLNSRKSSSRKQWKEQSLKICIRNRDSK
jgi:hypothetical protein